MASHTGTDWSDLNWETEEVIDWMMNDKALYHETEDVTHLETMAEIVMSYFLEAATDIDFEQVDWDAVVNYRNEE